jgi:peptide-methionine (S)-S-oxide reductase
MSIFTLNDKSKLVEESKALLGRSDAIFNTDVHFVTKKSFNELNLSGLNEIIFGMGCFWGAEKYFWDIPGVKYTSVGYAAGFTPNATYEEVCSGLTGHNEVVQVIYAKSEVSLEMLLKVFWENHDPTQGMRQGYDRGTQYRSGIYFSDQEDLEKIEILRDKYQSNLSRNSYGEITTEIKEISNFYFAEDYHQQYLAKNPNGYCGHGGCGISLED